MEYITYDKQQDLFIHKAIGKDKLLGQYTEKQLHSANISTVLMKTKDAWYIMMSKPKG